MIPELVVARKLSVPDPTKLIPLVISKGPQINKPMWPPLQASTSHNHLPPDSGPTGRNVGGKRTEGSFAKVFDVNSLSPSPHLASPPRPLLASRPTIHHPRKPDLPFHSCSPLFDSLDLSSDFYPNQPRWLYRPNSPMFG